MSSLRKSRLPTVRGFGRNFSQKAPNSKQRWMIMSYLGQEINHWCRGKRRKGEMIIFQAGHERSYPDVILGWLPDWRAEKGPGTRWKRSLQESHRIMSSCYTPRSQVPMQWLVRQRGKLAASTDLSLTWAFKRCSRLARNIFTHHPQQAQKRDFPNLPQSKPQFPAIVWCR